MARPSLPDTRYGGVTHRRPRPSLAAPQAVASATSLTVAAMSFTRPMDAWT